MAAMRQKILVHNQKRFTVAKIFAKGHVGADSKVNIHSKEFSVNIHCESSPVNVHVIF
jgi:hypothetical protein